MEIEKLKTGNEILKEITSLKLIKSTTIASMKNIPFRVSASINFFEGNTRGINESESFHSSPEIREETIKKVGEFFDGIIKDLEKEIEKL